MLTMGFWPDAKCCRCKDPVEDSEHVLRCPQADASTTWEHSLAVLKRHLVLANTDPQITKNILSALQAWRIDSDPPSSHPNRLIAAALRDQAALGWRSFLEGLPCNAWTDAQTAYELTNRQHSCFSPGAWASQLVRWVWEIPWALWTQRNDWLHCKETIDRAMGPIDAGIRFQLELGTVGLGTRDANFFDKFKTTILTKHNSDRRAWLDRILAAQANDTDRQSRRIMSRWLASAN
jgi:hypothetical protein